MTRPSHRLDVRREDIQDDTPVRLDVAARLAFPDGTINASGLRREAEKGRLQIWRIANKDMTTMAAVAKMVEMCKLPPRSQAPGRTIDLSSPDHERALAAARYRASQLQEQFKGKR